MIRTHRVLLAATALVASALLPPTALAAPAPVDYVALGDSYVSGTGTRSYDPASGSCQRSTKAYPALWAALHQVSSFKFVACSGAETADVLNKQVAALSAGTDLVTISIGGNDAGFVDVLTACQIGTDRQCDDAITKAEAFARTQLPARLDATYKTIKSKAPQARVVVVGYPRLFELGACGFGSISEARRTRLNAAADVLSGITTDRAKAAGFSFADARGAFTGHGVCAREQWINPLSFPISESYHPSVAGHLKGYLPVLAAVTG